MYISVDWLKEYVDLDGVDIDELFLKFTMTTAEVEELKKSGSQYDNIVVGRVDSVEPHPDADKLRVTQVFDGEETRQVVCGASNVREGMLTTLAKPGAQIGDMKIKKGKLRGQASLGMLCSAVEIGLGEEADGIMDLQDDSLTPGQPIAQAMGLDDVIVDIDNKSLTHRPDLWGHYGIAREVAAIVKRDLKYPVPALPAGGSGASLKVTVEATDLCPRYMAAVIENVTVKPSPEWMQRRLMAADCRPINNIVDITNFVMLELGQPMHAFDATKVAGNEIRIRRAKAGETLLALDETELELDEEMLVIADSTKPIALAGVIGGDNSKIEDCTTTIVMEAANFAPANNRMTSVRSGIRTDSSARYEKHLDPRLVEQGAARFLTLLLETCPEAKIASDIVDVDQKVDSELVLEITVSSINRKLGTSLSREMIVDILTRLAFEVSGEGDALAVKVPSFRATKDVTLPIDLVEEIGRVFGYDNIDEMAPAVSVAPVVVTPMQRALRETRELMAHGFGFDEVYNYSFLNEKAMQDAGIEADTITLRNPLSSEHDRMRPSMVPAVLKNVADNCRHLDDFRLFEIGESYFPSVDGEALPEQRTQLCAALRTTGSSNDENFYALRDAALEVARRLGCELKIRPAESVPNYSHPARCADLYARGGKDAVVLGQVFGVHPKVAADFGMTGDVLLVTLELEQLVGMCRDRYKFSPISRFPTVPFDVAVTIDEQCLIADVFAVIQRSAKAFIKDISVFDVYRSEQVGEGKKSVAIKIIMGSDKETMGPKQIEKTQNNIIKQLDNAGFSIR